MGQRYRKDAKKDQLHSQNRPITQPKEPYYRGHLRTFEKECPRGKLVSDTEKTSTETKYTAKRDWVHSQKRPSTQPKATEYTAKRDRVHSQKRPSTQSKETRVHSQKRPEYTAKRDPSTQPKVHSQKRPSIQPKETEYTAKRDRVHSQKSPTIKDIWELLRMSAPAANWSAIPKDGSLSSARPKSLSMNESFFENLRCAWVSKET